MEEEDKMLLEEGWVVAAVEGNYNFERVKSGLGEVKMEVEQNAVVL